GGAGRRAGWRRGTSPAAVSTWRASYTACRETWPTRSRTPEAIASAPRWSPFRTVSSSATRTAVTRRPAPRSSSAVAGAWDAVMGPTYRRKHEGLKTTNRPSLRQYPRGRPPHGRPRPPAPPRRLPPPPLRLTAPQRRSTAPAAPVYRARCAGPPHATPAKINDLFLCHYLCSKISVSPGQAAAP